MITIFNRKELLITTDMSRQGHVRDILSANGIDYTVRVINPQSARSRARYGTFGADLGYSYEYKIYVHKKDYEYALKLIR